MKKDGKKRRFKPFKIREKSFSQNDMGIFAKKTIEKKKLDIYYDGLLHFYEYSLK